MVGVRGVEFANDCGDESIGHDPGETDPEFDGLIFCRECLLLEAIKSHIHCVLDLFVGYAHTSPWAIVKIYRKE